jgi:hypothetical protein
MACEAPCDLGWVIARETLLRPESSSEDARKEEVEDRERLAYNVSQLSLLQLYSTYTYCEAFLEVRMEAFARILNCGRSIFCSRNNPNQLRLRN